MKLIALDNFADVITQAMLESIPIRKYGSNSNKYIRWQNSDLSAKKKPYRHALRINKKLRTWENDQNMKDTRNSFKKSILKAKQGDLFEF